MRRLLLEKHRPGSKRVFGKRYVFSKKPVYRRRQRFALLALCTPLVLLASWFLISSFFDKAPAKVAAGPVARVSTPEIQKAPEMLADLELRKQPAYEGETSGQRSANREAPEEKASGAKQGAPAPPEDPTLYMTVPKLDLYDHTVRNDASEWALSQGAVKLPPTGFPWQGGANTYIAGHRIGWPNTESYYQFYNLPLMQNGDEVILSDANGTVYTYEVSKVFAVSPDETWVTNPIAGRDVVTLQTCTETPDDWWTIGPKLYAAGPDSGRLVVRADKVSVDYAT
ncbi:MAG: class E sortase [Rubrobacteraceae bacterium]